MAPLIMKNVRDMVIHQLKDHSDSWSTEEVEDHFKTWRDWKGYRKMCQEAVPAVS